MVVKCPNMFEKLWGIKEGRGFSCFEVKFVNVMAIRVPRMVTVKAASFRPGVIVMIGVFEGKKLEVRSSPAIMLPQARRLIGLIT